VVAFLCLYPFKSDSESAIPHFDKIVHLTLFLILSYLWLRGLSTQTQFKRVQQRAVLIALLSTISYGVLIEILQELMCLGRQFDVLDIAADAGGVLFGYGLFRNTR